jgi:hypothetical protein
LLVKDFPMSNLFSKEDLSQLSNSVPVTDLSDPPVKKKEGSQSLFTEDDLKEVKGDFFGALADVSLASSSSSTARVIDLPDDYGASQYDAGINYAHQLNNLNEMRAQAQPLYDKVGNSLVKLAGGTALNTAGAGATLLGAPKALLTLSLEPLWNNSAARYIDSLTEDMQESFPHYYMQAEREKTALGQLGTYNFWGDQFVNGLSFLTGAALTGGLTNVVLKGLSLGAKVAMQSRVANSMRKVMFNSTNNAKYLRNMTGQGIVDEGAGLATKRMWSDVLSTSAHLATGAVYESGLEARMGYDTTLDLALERPEYKSMFDAYEQRTGTPPTREEKLMMIPEEDRKNMVDMAVGLSNVQFGANMLLVGSGNAIMLGRMYGPGMKRMFGSVGKAAGKVEDLAIKGIKKTGLGDVGAGRVVGTGRWLMRGVHEGFIEEGGQGTLARMSENYAYNAARSGKQFELDLLEYVGGMGEAISETLGTKEGQTEIGLGFLLGIMGMPKVAGGSGMFMSGSIAETQSRLTAKNNLEEFKKKMTAKFLEHRETHPEKYLNQAHATFLAKQLHGRVEARILAEKEGRVFDAKNLEEDDFFDHMFYLNETGQLEDAMKMFEEGMKMDPDSFKEVYGYDPAMTVEDLNLRKAELRSSFSDRVTRFKKVADMIDRSFPMTFEEKYANVDDVNNIGSNAGRRRFMMRYASKAEENDKREKQIIAEIAEMTGGEILFDNADTVDEIVYRQTDGKVRVARMGTLNLNTSVAGQLIETRQRIAEIESVNPERRPVAMQEDLEGLREFEKVLAAEKDMTKPVAGILLESKRDVEMESLEALSLKDPILATANEKDIIQKLDDLRKLRIQRKQFTDMFIAASSPETFEDMLRVQRDVVAEVEKEFETQKAEAITAFEEVNTAISDMQERIRAYKAVGYADLEERLEELKEAMAKTGETLQIKLASVAGIEENIAELSAEMPELEAEFQNLREKVKQLETADEEESIRASRMLFDPPGYVLGALELIESDEPIVRQQLVNVQEASAWLYQEYKRINFLIQEGRLPVSEHYAKRIVTILARDIEALEAYVAFDAERADTDNLSFRPTLRRIDKNLKERLKRLDKKRELYNTTTALDELRKGIDTRKITMAELKEDLATAIQEKDAHEEEFNTLKGRVGIARQELNDMLKATDLLSKKNVTDKDLEKFIEAVQAAENMFVEEGEELEYFKANTEGSEVLMRRYVQAKRQLDQDVQGSIDILNQGIEDANKQLEILKAQIETAQSLIDSASKDLVTTLTELAKTDPALAAELEDVYAGDIRLFIAQSPELKNALLSKIQGYTAELARIEAEKNSSAVQRDYMQLRMVDVFQRVMDAPDMSDMSDVEEMPFTAEDAEEDFDPLIKAERPGGFLPSINVGFHKSITMSHSDAIGSYKRLVNRKDLTQEEQMQLDRLDNILRWYKWLQNPEDMDNWIESPNTRMLVFSEKSMPDALKEKMAGTFYLEEGETESQELKMVPVRVSENGSYELILEGSKFIYASMMDADLGTDVKPRFYDQNELSEDEKQKRLNDYKAERERLLALDSPVLIRPYHGSSGVPITQEDNVKNAALPINDVMSVRDLSKVPLKISMPTTDDKGTKSTVVEFPDAPGSVVAGVGKVFAYDSVRKRYIPMERSLLSQEDSTNVARMYHLMLKTYLEKRAAGMDHVTAKKTARELDLGKGITLRSQIRDIIHEHWNKNNPSQYQIVSRLENGNIIFGLDGKITLANFEAKDHVYDAFMQFLANKRYHVKADTLAISSNRQVVDEQGKKTEIEGKSWSHVQLKEDLTVKVTTAYPNYVKFLLTPVNGKAPVMSRMRAYKSDTKLTPTSVGGYVIYSSTDLSENNLSTVDKGVALPNVTVPKRLYRLQLLQLLPQSLHSLIRILWPET